MDDLSDELPNREKSDSHAFLRIASDQSRRKLPADFNMDPAQIVIIAIIVVVLFCCLRGMLCDILACVCLYEICCDDAAIGGFALM